MAARIGYKMQEKRKHPRLKEKLPFEIGCDSTVVATETKNISCSGAYCAINKTFPPMSKVKISMAIPNKKGGKIVSKKIICEGVILRCTPPEKDDPPLGSNAAIMFTEISEKDKEVIADYIKLQLMRLKELYQEISK